MTRRGHVMTCRRGPVQRWRDVLLDRAAGGRAEGVLAAKAFYIYEARLPPAVLCDAQTLKSQDACAHAAAQVPRQ